MLFTVIMIKKRIYLYGSLAVFVLLIGVFFPSKAKEETFSETVKISLRDIGNKLLLTNEDSTSLVLPIKEISQLKYRLSFDEKLFLEPSHVVSIVEESFQKSTLPDNYRVIVSHCEDKEVAYSYAMSEKLESTIISCSGRVLPRSCYIIDFRFIGNTTSVLNKRNVLLILFLFTFVIVVFDFLLNRRKEDKLLEERSKKLNLGSFQFYPEQNKLVKAAVEVSLSKKECELLTIFVANPNQIIKRDELTKKVWEDNGVFVGRSLDTYISKLRKKLKDDESIKLTNIHGVGYKLEINR